MIFNYEKLLSSAGKFRIELGLGRISKILELLGNPQNNLKIIHIAGTNGKGSVCAILEEIFVKAGFKTGKFISPHLFSYTERIAVNKHPISDAELDKITAQILELDNKHNIGLTEFEILTAAGFLYFNKKACEIVILEVGLGGRLDSTNVITNPLVSIITSISLEHTERLGNSLEKIAFEKAGIVKKDTPTVILKENAAYQTLKNEVQTRGGVLYEAEKLVVDGLYAIINFEEFKNARVNFNLCGKHQGENLALALKAVEVVNAGGAFSVKIDFDTIKAALKDVKWPFRLEKRCINGADVLIDACHNSDGARVLREYLDENYRGKRVKFIFGCLKNKDYKRVLGYLTGGFNEFCFYEFDYLGALKYEEFMANVPKLEGRVREIKDPVAEINNGGADLTIICGSIYMLGQIFKDF